MPDVIITGATGFVGSYLMTALRDAGLDAAAYADVRDTEATATTLVHCASIHDDAVANAAYTADVLATMAARVKRFVNFQSFSTLHGFGAVDAGAVNCGKIPAVLAPYPWSKLLQEKTLLREAARYPALAVRLVYLPAVLGGGSWGRVIDQAKANGVVLPPMMAGTARANAVDVADVARHLVAHAGDVTAGVSRVILNDPASATASWNDFFRDAKFVATDDSPKAMAKLAATAGALAAYGILKRARPPAIAPGETDRRPPRPPRAPGAAPAIGAGPAYFTGLIQHLVRTQPYIAANT